MTWPTTDQIAGWVALGISMFGLWKVLEMFAKERSVGKTKLKEMKTEVASLRTEIAEMKKKCDDYDELKDDFEYLEAKFDKIRDKILDKISL